MEKSGWIYIMADRYRGTMYVGVTADLAARVTQHRRGEGSDFCARYGLKHLVWAGAAKTRYPASPREAVETLATRMEVRAD